MPVKTKYHPVIDDLIKLIDEHKWKPLFEKAIQPNSTTLMEITLRRIVDREVFRLEKPTGDDIAFDFKKVTPSLA